MSARNVGLTALAMMLVLLLQGHAGALPTGDSSNSLSPEERNSQAMEEAKRLVIEDILSGDVSGKAIYMVKSPISEGTIVRGWKADEQTFAMPFEKGWFFFIDDYWMANWEHPCRYVFVDFEGKIYQVFRATTPPAVLERSVSAEGQTVERRLKLEEIEESIRQRPMEEEQGDEEEDDLGEFFGQMGQPSPSGHVILISGGYDEYSNYPRYLKDLRHYYVTLTRYGYTDGQIDVLYADGSAADLDCDGDNDIDGNARKTTVQAAFNALPLGLDYLHVFVTDHGGTDSGPDGAQYGDSRIWLWNQEWITDVEVAGLISGRNPECASYVLEQCFSGGFIDNLLTTADKVVISAACRGDEYSWACDTEGEFDEFVYHYTNALRWAKPSGDNTAQQICQDGAAVNADADGSGIISLREAHNYALTHDSQSESPQFAETPVEQGDKAWLGGCEENSLAFTFTCNETSKMDEVWDTVTFDPLLTNTGAAADSYLVTLAENPPTPEEWWVRLSCWGICWDTTMTTVRIYTDDPLLPTQTDQMYLDVIPRTAGQGNFTLTVESLSMPDLKLSSSITFLLNAYLCGDANADGVIDLADIVHLVNYLYRGDDPPVPMEAGDANCDGIVDVADVVCLVNYLYRGGSPPSC
jgi:hypothetical protein